MKLSDGIVMVLLTIVALEAITDPAQYHDAFVVLALFIIAIYTVKNGGNNETD